MEIQCCIGHKTHFTDLSWYEVLWIWSFSISQQNCHKWVRVEFRKLIFESLVRLYQNLNAHCAVYTSVLCTECLLMIMCISYWYSLNGFKSQQTFITQTLSHWHISLIAQFGNSQTALVITQFSISSFIDIMFCIFVKS